VCRFRGQTARANVNFVRLSECKGGYAVILTCHYLAEDLDKKKIISQIKRRQKAAIVHYQNEKTMIEALSKRASLTSNTPPIEITADDFLEKVVVVNSPFLISTYATITTKWQEMNNTWIKFDTRPGSPTQKLAALMFCYHNNKPGIEVWHKGNLLDGFEINPVDSIDSLPRFLRDINCEKICDTWLQYSLNDMCSEAMLGVPLLLPDNLGETHKVLSQTRFTTFYGLKI
jgi:hypothetical protein